jgi:membrane protease YdiL (CAAX protease family)
VARGDTGRRLLDSLPIPPEEVAGLLLTMGALLPAALYVTWAADGRDGLRRLGSRLLRWRVGAGWWLLALAGLPALALGIGLLVGDTLVPVEPVPFLVGQAGLLMVNFALVNLWEETAWSGVVQTRLERRHGILLAALITAIPFALVHTPLAFLNAEVTIGSVLTALVMYLMLGVLFRPTLAVVMRGAADSVLVVAVLHSVFNRTNNSNGIAASLLSGDAGQLPILLATVPLTLIAAVAARRRLGPRVDAEDVAGLTVQHPADARQGAEADRPSAAALEHRQVGDRDADLLGEPGERHAALRQDPVEVDDHTVRFGLVERLAGACVRWWHRRPGAAPRPASGPWPS